MLAKKLLGAAAAAEPVYIEDVFSTYLYTGNGSTQTITNGIDLAGEGGLVWLKQRNATQNHGLFDTARGPNKWIASNLTTFNTIANTVTAFNSNGFTLGNFADFNGNSNTYASWTFRKAEKFFDVVTYTGNGSTQTISHNLGSVPGCIIYKCTSTSNNWIVYHRSLGEDYFLQLNLTSASTYSTTVFDITAPTSTTFTVGSLSSGANVNGQTYVAYLFAHNAGGFGDNGNQNVISCGSFTTNGSGVATVDLGWEPQWVMVKTTAVSDSWRIYDVMRGMPVDSSGANLNANTTAAESAGYQVSPTATGFTFGIEANRTYIYIAIRRGPMKTPETGTEVFDTEVTAGSYPRTTLSGFPVDMTFAKSGGWYWFDRMRGAGKYIQSNSTSVEASTGGDPFFDVQDGILEKGGGGAFFNAGDRFWMFRRAPGFFDVVCYTGTGVARTVNHNLGVAPELMIVKKRSTTGEWTVYYGDNTSVLRLRLTNAKLTLSSYWNNTSPTASVFTVGNDSDVNASGETYVSYLFSSVDNISKVGTYSGTGTTNQINCGFTNGARFVLIKRIDSTGAWYVWDTARGIVAGNDPYLLLNSTAAEVTSTDYIDTYSAGFEISSTAPAAINANGGTFIFLAIA